MATTVYVIYYSESVNGNYNTKLRVNRLSNLRAQTLYNVMSGNTLIAL